MNGIFNLALPWIGCGLALFAFLWLRGWIQRHLFGVGFLFAQERHLATVIYCIVLFPGIFLHEATRYIVAGMLNVKHKRVMKWPKADPTGKINIAFVVIEDKHNPIYTALIGIVPFALGMLLAIFISTSLLALPAFVSTLSTSNVSVITAAFRTLISHPDFLLWFYLLFVLTNTIWPTEEDRLGWEILFAIVVGAIIFLTVIGFQAAVLRWFSAGGAIANLLNVATTILLIAIGIDGAVALIIAVLERGAERVTHRSAPYHTAIAKPKTAKAEVPHLTSISQYRFPLPAAPKGDRIGLASSVVPRPATAPLSASAIGSAASKPTLPSASPAPGMTAPVRASPGLPAASPAANPNRLPTASPAPIPTATAGSAPHPAFPTATPAPSPAQSAPPVRPALPATASTGSNPNTGLVPARSNSPEPAPIRSASPFGSSGIVRPGVSNVAHPDRKEDYIDAETIEEDDPQPPVTPRPTPPPPNREPNAAPSFARSFDGSSSNAGGSRPTPPPAPVAIPDDSPRYEPLDDAP